MTTRTSAPSWVRSRTTATALYAAMPPVTQKTILRPWARLGSAAARPARYEGVDTARGPGDLLDAVGGALVGDLALGDLLERDRQRLGGPVGTQRHLRGGELGHALAELSEVRIDLPAALRGQDNQRVL